MCCYRRDAKIYLYFKLEREKEKYSVLQIDTGRSEGMKKERFNKAPAVAKLTDFLLSITTELFAFLKKFHPFPSGDRPALISCDLTVHKILRERERGRK